MDTLLSFQSTRPRNEQRTIAFFNHQIGQEWTLRPWWGVQSAAHQHNINLVSCFGNTLAWPYQHEEQANVVYALANSRRLDGLVIWKASLVMGQTEQEVENFCHRYGVPVVTIEGDLAGAPCVTYNNYLGMKEMMDHLIDVHGFQRIGFLGFYQDHVGFRTRYQAYADSLTARGMPIDPALAWPWVRSEDIEGLIRKEVVLDYLKGALAAGAQALVGALDNVSIQMMSLLAAQGINVPKDIAVVGFDGFSESRSVTPPLTTVQPSWYDLGYMAVDNLVRLMDGQAVPAQISVPHVIKTRHSCGCQDPSVAAAAFIPENKGDIGPQKIIEKVAESLASLDLDGGTQAAKRLVDSFLTEISQAKPGLFLEELETLLRRIMDSGGLVTLSQEAITALRMWALPNFARGEAKRAEALLHQARILIGKTSERAQAYQRLQADQRADRMRSVGQSLITTFDMDQVIDVLAEQIPGLGVRSGYLALFEEPHTYHYPEPAPEWARVALAFNEQGRVNLPPEGLRFHTTDILPDEFWPVDKARDFVVQAIYFKEHQIGYVVLEGGSHEGYIYEALRSEISSAMQGSILVKRVENRALQLQTAAEVSRAASSLLDSDELSRQVVNVVRDRFHFYYVGLFLVDDSGKWAVLRAGTGEGGQKMIERNHRLEIGAKSMIGQCIANKKARIAGDVGKDAVHFNNPFLPETRSEVALPLISRDEAIGALTVQSDQVGAFSEDDLIVLQTMADQVANAVGNAHLFEESQKRASELARAKELAEIARMESEKEKEAAEFARAEADKARKATEAANQLLAQQMWQTTGQAMLNEALRGEQDIPTLANNVIQQLCKYLEVQSGALYLAEENHLVLTSTYAFRPKGFDNTVQVGEGQVGQTALEKKQIASHIPDEYLKTLFDTTGKLFPKFISTSPLVNNGILIGVLEMHSLAEFTTNQMEFLNKAMESVVVAFTTALARRRVNELLSETRLQAEELQTQEEELRATNEELEAQTDSLRASEAKLKNANTELEEKAAALQESSLVLKEKQDILDQQNQELREAQQSLEQKAADLAQASKYKSEFLANMSHELRTPLNSLLILGSMLAKNEEGNLTPDQVESAQIIHSGGSDLLNLINEILDLSKVEAGKMQFRFAPMELKHLVNDMRTIFTHVAEERGLEFLIHLAEDLPETIETDQQRLEQVIKNLLSNAFKFTSNGSVRLEVVRPRRDEDRIISDLNISQTIAIRVIDTGIGMTPEQQKVVFEAFQQADGSTSRQYGGTGLGLTIAREMAIHLGGQIHLLSEVGKGSTFTLYLPIIQPVEQKVFSHPVVRPTRPERVIPRPTTPSALPQPPATEKSSTEPVDDRNDLKPTDRVLLVIEDDPQYAQIVYTYAKSKKFKILLADTGEIGVKLAKTYKTDAIILDLGLPGMSGLEVLDVLKDDATTRHIPVHIISASNEDPEVFQRGAVGFLTKPTSQEDIEQAFGKIEQMMAKKIKKLLLVEDDSSLRKSIHKLLEGNDIAITETGDGQAAIDLLATQRFDCMILDLTLPDMSGFDLLNHLHSDDQLYTCPVIIYTGKELTEEESLELDKYADSVIVKGARSPERLLDETALFLHRVVADMPEDKQQTIMRLHDTDAIFAGKEILIVDDDARNAYALSRLLASRGLKPVIASSGQKGLDMLEKIPVKMVLMDVMMPGMDGYEAIRRMRSDDRFRKLPILALTAKAMKGDREKCIAAGANDYLSKPVEAKRLFSMLRVWLSK